MRTVTAEHHGATGRAVETDRGWEADLAAGTGRLDHTAAVALLRALGHAVAGGGGGVLRWRVANAGPDHERIAAAAGLTRVRELWQMRRALPVEITTDLATRPFRSGIDDEAWLAVNNRAFAWHPDQSGWTRTDLARRLAEPWFDPGGFLVHEIDGALAGFCWTKEHREVDPPLGEIFVIAADPTHHGRGLGRQLVLAGLAHLAERGAAEAMLYTEHDNEPAVRLYRSLGFTVHHADRVYERAVVPAPGATARSAGQTPTPTSEPMP